LDLIVENIDIAIRFGELPDSSLIAQRIGKERALCGRRARISAR
jgi:DNA-binding transcriptional LysR family regulator